MTYTEALDYVFRFADFERGASQVRYREFNLDRVRALLALAGNPHLALPTVHVAGTKGKGSTVMMTAAVLQAAGMRPGVYTSPHLHTVRERIVIGGSGPIQEEEFARCVERLAPLADRLNDVGASGRLTTFELLTAVAFVHFAEAGARSAVVEVGLGGRLDATNVVSPLVCGITNISYDHMDILGHTLSAIAGEKAGIIKSRTPVVSAPQPAEALEVIERVAREQDAPMFLCGRHITWELGKSDLSGQSFIINTAKDTYRLWTPLLGDFQAENAATAVGICERLMEAGLPVDGDAIERGMAQVVWPGRLEVLGRQPLIVADGAHNPYSVRRVIEEVRKHLPYERLFLVFGVTRTKDLGAMAMEIGGTPGRVLAARSRHPRAVPPEEIVKALRAAGVPAEASGDVASAVSRARELAGPRDLILATGSLFVAAEAREAVLGIQPEAYAFATTVGI